MKQLHMLVLEPEGSGSETTTGSGNGMEMEWNAGNERKKEMAKLDYNNANHMHSRIGEHWKDSAFFFCLFIIILL